MENNNSEKYVKWGVFLAMISLLVVGIGWNLVRTESLAKQVDNYSEDVQTTKVLLASMGTDLVWIKSNLLKIQESLDIINKQKKQ